MVDFILGQNCTSKELLNFLCSHGNAWMTYVNDDKEYIVELLSPYKENIDDDILRSFDQNPEGRYNCNYRFNRVTVEKYTRREYINVFEVIKNNDDIDFKPIVNKEKILNELYDTRYSVNELVSTASDNEINDFIFDIFFQNEYIKTI